MDFPLRELQQEQRFYDVRLLTYCILFYLRCKSIAFQLIDVKKDLQKSFLIKK